MKRPSRLRRWLFSAAFLIDAAWYYLTHWEGA